MCKGPDREKDGKSVGLKRANVAGAQRNEEEPPISAGDTGRADNCRMS